MLILFSTIFQAQIQTWRAYLPKREGVIFESKHKVCKHHFTPDSFKDNKILIRGEWVELPLVRKGLKDDAVPTIFPGVPLHVLKKVPIKRKDPADRPKYQPRPKKAKMAKIPPVAMVAIEDTADKNTSNTGDALVEEKIDISLDIPPMTLFEKVLKCIEMKEFPLPGKWKDFINFQKTIITICKFSLTDENVPQNKQMSIVLRKDGDERYLKVGGTKLPLAHEMSVELGNATNSNLLLTLIVKIDRTVKVCLGSEKKFEKNYVDECPLLFSITSRTHRCVGCSKEKKRLYSEARYNEERMEYLKKKWVLEKQQVKKFKAAVIDQIFLYQTLCNKNFLICS